MSLPGVSVEPSTIMIRQRASDRFPVVQGKAEYLPFPNQSFDAVMGVMTMHHWSDLTQGLRELKRLARSTVVLMTHDPSYNGAWLDQYLPDRRLLDQHEMPSIRSITKMLGASQVLPERFRLIVMTASTVPAGDDHGHTLIRTCDATFHYLQDFGIQRAL